MKVNDFLNTLKGKIIGAVTGLIVVFLVAKWEYVKSTFDNGVQIEKESKFNHNLVRAFKTDSITDLAVDKLMSNPKFAKKILEHPDVKNYVDEVGKGLRDEIVENVVKSDSNKVSMRSFIGKEADIRDEQVLPLISEIVKAWKDGYLMTKKEAEVYIKKELKRRTTERRSY